MKTLSEALSKYQTLNADDLGTGLCLACSNGWFFDRGRIFTCTTCGADKEVFTYEEEQGFVHTSCIIRSSSLGGLKRGIEVYFKRFPEDRFLTKQVTYPRETLSDFWAVEMARTTEEITSADR